jgi:hypothetical protein
MSKLLGLAVGVALLGGISVASAGEPVALNETEMDQVAAGAFNFFSANVAVIGQQAGSAAFAGNSLVNVGTVSIAGSSATNNASVVQF